MKAGVPSRVDRNQRIMKRKHLTKYLLAYVGLAGFSVSVQASLSVVAPSTPGSWSYETITYAGAPGSGLYNVTPSGALPIVASPASPGDSGSVQLISTAVDAVQISTTAYNGQLLSSLNALSFATYSVANNGQQFPLMQILLSNGDMVSFEPPYQTPSTGNKYLPNQGVPLMNTWQTWNALVGGWYDNNGIFNPGAWEPGLPGVGSLRAFEAQAVNAGVTIAGIYLFVGLDGTANEGYVNDITIGTTSSGTTTYDFEPNAPVPEPTTMIAGALLLLPFGASTLRMLRKKQTA